SAPPRTAREVVLRLWRGYLKPRAGLLFLAIVAMIVAAAMTSSVPLLLRSVVTLFLRRDAANLLVPLALAGFGVMVLRGFSPYIGKVSVDSLGERAVAAAQRDMFAGLIHNDLAALNAVHSGQFVSGFLFDATVMRDALSQSVAAIFLEFFSMIGLLG